MAHADNYLIAKQFGFVPSYPPDAPTQGPVPEAWEFTYIGTETIACGVTVVAPDHPLTRCPRLAATIGGDFDAVMDSDIAIYDGRTGVWDVNESTGSSFVPDGWADFTTTSRWQA